MKIFVSGAAGFIGGAIARAGVAAGYQVQGGIRAPGRLPPGVMSVVTGDLADTAPDLRGVSLVVHAAGLGHRRGVTAPVWRRANIDAAARLAAAAAAAGCRRFILISTAYVLGRVVEQPVTDEAAPNPMDGYAASKLAAERALAVILGDRLTVLRPAAVIGPGAPGNLVPLMALLRRRVPLPFANIRNARAFIGRDDLAALVLAVLAAELPPPTLLAANPQAIATPELIRALGVGLGVPARLFACPAPVLAAMAAALGRQAIWQSLSGSFVAEPLAALALGWRPGNLLEQLAETARYYHTTSSTA